MYVVQKYEIDKCCVLVDPKFLNLALLKIIKYDITFFYFFLENRTRRLPPEL